MTLPRTFAELLKILHADPTSDEATCLIQHLVTRTASFTLDREEAYLPLATYSHDRHQLLAPRIERVRRHVQAYGLDLMTVPAVCVRGVLVYVHLQQARGGA